MWNIQNKTTNMNCLFCHPHRNSQIFYILYETIFTFAFIGFTQIYFLIYSENIGPTDPNHLIHINLKFTFNINHIENSNNNNYYLVYQNWVHTQYTNSFLKIPFSISINAIAMKPDC